MNEWFYDETDKSTCPDRCNELYARLFMLKVITAIGLYPH